MLWNLVLLKCRHNFPKMLIRDYATQAQLWPTHGQNDTLPMLSARLEHRGHLPVKRVRSVQEDPVAAVALPVAAEDTVQHTERNAEVDTARCRPTARRLDYARARTHAGGALAAHAREQHTA